VGSQSRRGSLTAIGAVSPPGGDLSEPVSQSTMRIVKVFWGLDAGLAHARHFPAINWLNSYSLYLDNLRPWFDENLGKSFLKNREKAMAILQEESELQEIVKLVGIDSLSDKDRLTLETAKMIREDFLQQNAFVDTDNYSDYERQAMLLEIILKYGELSQSALSQGAKLQDLINIEAKEVIGRAKVVPIDEYKEEYTRILKEMTEQINKTKARGELDD
jgi:V/A-type H+-transporting ATPase subunit A